MSSAARRAGAPTLRDPTRPGHARRVIPGPARGEQGGGREQHEQRHDNFRWGRAPVIAGLPRRVVDGFVYGRDNLAAVGYHPRSAHADLARFRGPAAVPGVFGLSLAGRLASVEDMTMVGGEEYRAACAACLVQIWLQVRDGLDRPVGLAARLSPVQGVVNGFEDAADDGLRVQDHLPFIVAERLAGIRHEFALMEQPRLLLAPEPRETRLLLRLTASAQRPGEQAGARDRSEGRHCREGRLAAILPAAGL